MWWSPMEIEKLTHDGQSDVGALTRKISKQDLNKNKFLPPEAITDTCPGPHLQTMVANGQSETPIGATVSRLKWQTFCSILFNRIKTEKKIVENYPLELWQNCQSRLSTS